jgi:Tfp pilus assembly protein PilV
MALNKIIKLKHKGATLVGVVIALSVFVIGLLAVAGSILFAYSMQLRSADATKSLLDVQSNAEHEYLRWALETKMNPKALANGSANGKTYDFTADGQEQTINFKNKAGDRIFDMSVIRYRYPNDTSVLKGRKQEIYFIGRKAN